MKILHVCLAAFYIDNYAYQENVLPRMQKKMGYEVRILASCETYINNKTLGYVEPSSYINSDGIPVTRLPYIRALPLGIAKKLRIYEGVSDYLNAYNPDFVFLHDIQFLSLGRIISYKKMHGDVIIVADGHTDYINSARNIISKRILHGIIYRLSIKINEKYISKFYGTLPPRNRFMSEMYSIPSNKLEYLPLGVDDYKISGLDHNKDKEYLAQKYDFLVTDYLVVTGGKMGQDKINVLDLMDAVKGMERVSLLIFGSFSEDLEILVEKRLCAQIRIAGWVNEDESMRVLSGADIAVFPYLHSTLWEQTAGIGTPLMVKKINGFDHVNICDNCIFLDNCYAEEIRDKLLECREYDDILKENALHAKKVFAYSSIAKHVIDDYQGIKGKE